MKALVIGAGIGGLATAIGLGRLGLDVEVYERAPALQEAGAGISLWANALRALRRLGAYDAVRPHGSADLRGALRTPDGRTLTPISHEAIARSIGEVGLGLHRAELQGALLETLGPGRLSLGRALASFEQDARGVTAHFEDGGSARGALLVGADGLRSVVRARLHGDAPPRYAGYTAWRAVVPFDPARVVPGETIGAGARFGQLLLPGGRVYWFATRNEPEGRRRPGGERDELLRTFAGWHEPVEALIRATDEHAVLRNDIYDRDPLPAWGSGRVTLLGDAAHPMTPNLGQGACQALEDAAVLMRRLDGAQDVPAALRAYEAARIPRTGAVVLQSRRLGQVNQWQHPLAVGVRSLLFRHLVPLVQQRQLERMLGYEF